MGTTVHFTNLSHAMSERVTEAVRYITNHGYTRGIIQRDFDDDSQPLVETDYVAFNGAQGKDHETFVLCFNRATDFTKTAQKPYHVYVVAICHLLGFAYGMAWDDEAYGDDEYIQGIELMSEALGNTQYAITANEIDNGYAIT